ncbi:YlmH/Sll1252 family protein [Miniphocaeibacter halophilus]|uniref:Uncharacterized protein n=1 Tax=Miniphocaeibacter halophilus TaxID=2931922 RepID=A0AC61MQ02_9FIRM|nr:YlmH/Sll1252 family protein [Miniphocaeibacter halophilus]QQK07692.1 hypothetical protein JFY71_10435 [Miniphocaeibacter halophilus]
MEYSKILNHIQDIETKQTIKKFIDSLFVVEKKGGTYCSDFLTPNEINYCISSINTYSNLDYMVIPNLNICERNCILVSSYIDSLNIYEYINIISAPVIDNINHRDVLGSLLALGVNRSKIGDILFTDKKMAIVLRSSLTNYILQNLLSISKYNVSFSLDNEFSFNNLIENTKKYFAIVSSLRLDLIISEIINYPRNKTSSLLNSGKIKVNYEEIKKSHYELNEGDIISIKGFGRFKFLKVLGVTKKNKYKIEYIKYE